MSFARQNPGKPLFSQAQIISARERVLLAENRQLRDRNRRLKDAMLTLVERIEMQLPYLKEKDAAFTKSKPQENAQSRVREETFRERSRRYQAQPPKMEIFETVEEPIEFGEPAPEMRFGGKAETATRKQGKSKPTVAADPAAADYHISPDLAPEEIDILKSPTRERVRQRPVHRETVEVVDLHPARKTGNGTAEHYEAGGTAASDIPAFEFSSDEPIVDIDFERKETLRAAMRRRVNRLRW